MSRCPKEAQRAFEKYIKDIGEQLEVFGKSMRRAGIALDKFKAAREKALKESMKDSNG